MSTREKITNWRQAILDDLVIRPSPASFFWTCCFCKRMRGLEERFIIRGDALDVTLYVCSKCIHDKAE